VIHVRRSVQLLVVVAVTVAGIRLATGAALHGIERYCPFGGLETAWSVITQQQFSCATGELNVSLFVAVVVLALLARKSFCSWICPVGTVHEWLGRLAGFVRRKVTGRAPRDTAVGWMQVPRKLDGQLRGLRYGVLAAVLLGTGITAELVFRPCDPFYVMFSAHGHDVEPWSYALLAILLGTGLVVAMAWCRYLCPLGAALWPFARFGLLRVRRDEHTCTGCGACDRACPHALQTATVPEVRSGECTLCLECQAACPVHGTLAVAAPAGPPVPTWVVPLLLVALTAGGVAGARAFSLPSYARTYDDGDATATVRMVVDGVRCVDTAETAAEQLDGVQGVSSLVAHASRNELVIEYRAEQIDVDAIREAIEAPVYEPATGSYLFHQFRVTEVIPGGDR
jgi:ferredoxin